MRILLTKLLLLVAVMLMPLGMAPAPAAANRSSAAMPMKHCPEQGTKHHSNGAFAECTMACSSALPAVDRAQEQPISYAAGFAAPTAIHVLDGLNPDTATPPPKSA